MRVSILGCGDAFDESLPNTSILVEAEFTMLLDCGFSAPPQVWRAAPDPNAIDSLYLSHAHADHYFGVPALLGRWWEDGRCKPLLILSQAAVLDQLRELLELGYRTLPARFQFPIEYRAVEESSLIDLLGATVTFAGTVHSLPNLSIRIESSGFTFVYSGDGMFTAASRSLCRGANLVVHEAYSFETSRIHSDIPQLLRMAREEQVQQLALVHVQRNVRAHERQRIEEAIQAAGLPVTLPDPI